MAAVCKKPVDVAKALRASFIVRRRPTKLSGEGLVGACIGAGALSTLRQSLVYETAKTPIRPRGARGTGDSVGHCQLVGVRPPFGVGGRVRFLQRIGCGAKLARRG